MSTNNNNNNNNNFNPASPSTTPHIVTGSYVYQEQQVVDVGFPLLHPVLTVVEPNPAPASATEPALAQPRSATLQVPPQPRPTTPTPHQHLSPLRQQQTQTQSNQYYVPTNVVVPVPSHPLGYSQQTTHPMSSMSTFLARDTHFNAVAGGFVLPSLGSGSLIPIPPCNGGTHCFGGSCPVHTTQQAQTSHPGVSNVGTPTPTPSTSGSTHTSQQQAQPSHTGVFHFKPNVSKTTNVVGISTTSASTTSTTTTNAAPPPKVSVTQQDPMLEDGEIVGQSMSSLSPPLPSQTKKVKKTATPTKLRASSGTNRGSRRNNTWKRCPGLTLQAQSASRQPATSPQAQNLNHHQHLPMETDTTGPKSISIPKDVMITFSEMIDTLQSLVAVLENVTVDDSASFPIPLIEEEDDDEQEEEEGQVEEEVEEGQIQVDGQNQGETNGSNPSPSLNNPDILQTNGEQFLRRLGLLFYRSGRLITKFQN
ncbi:hypothetical protein DFA_06801 [Cavenderia fasciculata]|uniref:Uncharacterized protein n=1 Tax=Cavenderia fasciculata TaxID=261658 RepID=F4Q2B4_CACFS|nr:uncharacterized protein DFA_06801 [Cavenderia fasciculata]EGG18134.1 hypothetical protein DFA_06801 [Cavenderia fasciculata]|eukprot:XP_004366175.1 hypothetical protein DFA_06801 [Cavenderia fasciculata]